MSKQGIHVVHVVYYTLLYFQGRKCIHQAAYEGVSVLAISMISTNQKDPTLGSTLNDSIAQVSYELRQFCSNLVRGRGNTADWANIH